MFQRLVFFYRLFGFSKLKHGNVGHVEQWFPGSTMMIGEMLVIFVRDSLDFYIICMGG